MLDQMFEITERKPLDMSKCRDVYLGSERELWKIFHRQKTAEAAVELLENIGIMN